jgi:hypothetical protein
MRRVIGGVLMLAGAYGLYWAYKAAAGHFPTTFSFSDPIIQYGLIGAFAFIVGYSVFHSYRPPTKKTMVCPNCNKLLEKGRRNCPYCNEQLVHY